MQIDRMLLRRQARVRQNLALHVLPVANVAVRCKAQFVDAGQNECPRVETRVSRSPLSSANAISTKTTIRVVITAPVIFQKL